jgi:transposase-like protein
MTSLESPQILKVDEVGRVRTPREKQEVVLDEYERSGMTGRQFAGHVGVKYPTLMSWVQRRRRERGGKVAGPGPEPRWIEAVVEGGGNGALAVELPGGVILRLGDRTEVTLAAELLRGLAYGRAC